MQRISVNTIIRKDRLKNGLHPIYVRIIAEGGKIDVRVPHYVLEADLQPNGSVRHKCFNSFMINLDIQQVLNEVNKVLLFHHSNGIRFTRESFNNLFRNKLDTTSLHSYMRTQAAAMGVCTRRLQHYNALAKHIETHFPKTTLADCTYNFLVSLETVFSRQLKMMQNTVASKMRMLKAIIGHAHRQKLIAENPFIHYKVPGFTSSREYLTKEEILLIEKFYADTGNTSQKNVAAVFLFLCYTGLRVGDFSRLAFSDIKDGTIDFIQGKTGRRCFIPLSAPAMRFIGTDGFTFYKIHDVKINAGLKTIAEKTGITKPLSCHVARHTFATMCLTLDVSIPAISKMLGHTTIATTMIYAKVLDEKKKSEMQKWSGFLDLKALAI